MKPALLHLLAALVLSAAAQARIGDSMLDLKVRYGQPLDRRGTKEAGTDIATFQYLDYRIVVTLQANRSVTEEFTRRDRRDLTLAEVKDLLAVSSDAGATWKQITATTWRQADRTATWSGRNLSIQSKFFGDR